MFNESGLLEEFDDGTARLTGTVVSSQDTNKFWDVDVWFDAAGERVRAKNELKDYVVSNGLVDLEEWYYYGIDENRSRLTGGGYYEDIVLQIADGRGYGMGAETQIGYGASGKNIDMGMASWISYNVIEDNNAEVDIANSMRADINVDLMFITASENNGQDVPEPMALAGLGLVGLGLCSRRQGRNEDVASESNVA